MLVVEDNALIAMLLAELLAGVGHDVCATAATEADAVIAATHPKSDLMIVDAGLGAGEAEFPPSRKSSGRDRSRNVHHGGCRKGSGTQAGRSGVRKPFRQSELASAIDKALAAVMPLGGRSLK